MPWSAEFYRNCVPGRVNRFANHAEAEGINAVRTGRKVLAVLRCHTIRLDTLGIIPQSLEWNVVQNAYLHFYAS